MYVLIALTLAGTLYPERTTSFERKRAFSGATGYSLQCREGRRKNKKIEY